MTLDESQHFTAVQSKGILCKGLYCLLCGGNIFNMAGCVIALPSIYSYKHQVI
ncbi:MAG: hypothetical protein ACI81A_001849 [Paraglaciecola sp.]|jgi:hypothetical protein